MKKIHTLTIIASLMAVTAQAEVTLIDDDFSTSTAGVGRFDAADIDADKWEGSSGWSVTGGALTNAATAGGATHLVNSVDSTDTSLTQVTVSFDYSVAAGSTLYFYSTLFTGESTTLSARNSKTDGTYWANDFAFGWSANAGFSGPEYNLKDGTAANTSDTAIAVTSFVGGPSMSGTFSQTYDISEFGGGDFNIADVSNVLAVFAVNAGAAGDGAISIDNFNMTAIPEPGTYALLGGLLALGHVMLRRRR